MAIPIYYDLDLPVIDLDGITTAATLGGAGNHVLDGALIVLNAAKYVCGEQLAGPSKAVNAGVRLIIDTTVLFDCCSHT